MPNYQVELDHLAQANRHIAEGEERILYLAHLIEKSRDAGWDTSTGERMLRLMLDTLDEWYVHRQYILDTIAKAEEPGFRQKAERPAEG